MLHTDKMSATELDKVIQMLMGDVTAGRNQSLSHREE